MTTSSCGCAWSADNNFFFFFAFYINNKPIYGKQIDVRPLCRAVSKPHQKIMFVTLVNLQLCTLVREDKNNVSLTNLNFFYKKFIGNSNSALYSCQLNLLLIFFYSKIFVPRGVETIKSKVIITIILALFSNCSKCFRLIQWKAYLFIVASNTQLLDNGAW